MIIGKLKQEATENFHVIAFKVEFMTEGIDK